MKRSPVIRKHPSPLPLLLTQAIREKNITTVKRLVKEMGDHPRTENLITVASYLGNLEIVKFLVESGWNIHTHEESPLRQAIIHHKIDIAEFLLESGANPNEKSEVILEAIKHNNLEGIDLLVKYGANLLEVNARALFETKDFSTFEHLMNYFSAEEITSLCSQFPYQAKKSSIQEFFKKYQIKKKMTDTFNP